MTTTLDGETADRFARIALGHVEREYPHKPGHVLAGESDVQSPRERHPVFFGSFDWHSCVHGYWMLVRLLNRFPDMPSAEAIRALLNRRLTGESIAGECATFDRPMNRGFERSYGWGRLLKLAAELEAAEDRRFARSLRPLTDRIVGRFCEFLPLATYPVRVGTHFNTAFALRLAADYGNAVGDESFIDLLRMTALRWYGPDENCPAWGEPSGDDFLSSTLIEAECMHRLLRADDFGVWFGRFLPGPESGEPKTLFSPASVSDRSDGKIAHLDGLNLSRAWCWRSLAASVAETDARRTIMNAAAERHLEAALPHVAGDYMGEHWLASFAVLALEA
ncbi:unnamed protein product [Ciceribacter sp. T2.26MG-112.2]|uniref:DUF2891 domain-containing protein n=1 Tax=Ciceribacter sp. T2.26MG-112.2 TaxID=3137154 RepID=UPI000E12A2C1|nr:DUF2891 domain-containing protein [Ciceribacter naphthalenivorans]SSC72451.1 unnamed protein product [Ciceribacter naphthalenivorans]